jgi:drug/metabolite transporter (DMT)-like permease
MASLPKTTQGATGHPTSVVPLACLLGVVVLLSSVTPVIKYVFQHSHVQPIGLASLRVMIGFLLLLSMTWLLDRRGLLSLSLKDLARLGSIGLLGVFSYAISAWGLMNTSVVHYALIYGLLPSLTAGLSVVFGHDRITAPKGIGILLSLAGCIVALYFAAPHEEAAFQFGDWFVLLFTVMMSAHIVFSSSVVKRFGVMVSNTVMFGSSSLVLSVGSMAWPNAGPDDSSPLVMVFIFYIGCATAAVFLLRCRSLQSLSPATVGTYHNLIPVCTVLLAFLCLDEPLGAGTILGGLMVLVGAEVVRRPQSLSSAALCWAKPRLPAPETPKERRLHGVAVITPPE